MDIKNKKSLYLLTLLLIGGFLMRVWGLWLMDLQGDAAHYAFRALGWFDSLLTQTGQTSPINWFGFRPWWSYLSFHDHPALGFAVMHIFFRIFGSRTFVVFLPFVFAGLGISYILYRKLRTLTSEGTALLALSIYSLASYAVWGSRTAYLEGIQVFFITLGFFAFLRYFETKRPNDASWWGIWTGLALMTKYTALFLPTGVVLYLVIWRHEWLMRKWHFWLGTINAVIILFPAILYNAMVFASRGHFDAALSSMLGQRPEDYSYITNGASGLQLLGPWLNLGSNLSLPFFILTLASLLWLFVTAVRNKDKSPLVRLLLTTIIALVLMFSVAGSSSRYLSIAMPFIAITIALAVTAWWRALIAKPYLQKAVALTIAIVFVLELGYSINSNILDKPIGVGGIAYAKGRVYRRGFQDVDNYIRNNIYPKMPPLRVVAEYQSPEFATHDVILVDERGDWFSGIWYYKRYLFYRLPLITIEDLFKLMKATSKEPTSAFDYLGNQGARKIWFVRALPDAIVRDTDETYDTVISQLNDQLAGAGIKPVIFYDYRGTPMFELYTFQLQ
ncbi:MAG: glycosyltransferase family 39 protein [Candidatus Komeilibacteria bacterium]|nr:glycosyltransferase family 39 protein [Candidatus Komeilibacteria bacterium]